MKITQEKRDTAFEKATEMQRNLYDTPEAARELHEIFVKHESLTKKAVFYSAVGDVILDLVPQEKLPELLVERLGIDQAKAMQVTADLLDFLTPLKDAPANPVQINTNTGQTDNHNLADEIAEAEAAMNAVQPMRTMSHDMEVIRSVVEEPVHQAPSQEEILDRSATAKDKNPEATWGTAQN